MGQKFYQTTILLFSFFIIACSDGKKNEEQSIDGKEISKAEYNEKWPFTVDRGILKCEELEEEYASEKLRAIIFQVDTKKYALNGTARTWANKYGYIDFEAIWAYDSLGMQKLIDLGVPKEEAKKNIIRIPVNQIIEDGQKLCNKQ